MLQSVRPGARANLCRAALASAAVVLWACGEAAESARQSQGPPPPIVEVALVERGSVDEGLALVGQLEADESVMLVGLVTKNSILIVEFANQLRAQGQELVAATIEASQKRYRPILMTAVSTIVGILPIALGSGAGGESRAPLGVAVVGGMLFSTLLSFFVVPAVYVALERVRLRTRGGRQAIGSHSPARAA